MNKIVYDARWDGDYGIARYARETRKRLAFPGVVDLISGQKPLSPVGISTWEIKNLSYALNRDFYYSPSFTPAAVYSSRQAITIHDLIHIDFAGENSPVKRYYYDYIVRPVIRKSDLVLQFQSFQRIKFLNGRVSQVRE